MSQMTHAGPATVVDGLGRAQVGVRLTCSEGPSPIMRIRVSRKFVISAVAVFAGLTVGIAAALWSSNGTGSGRSQARTAQTVTVTAATGTADLYPGFADGDVYFTLTNTNPYPIVFTAADAGTITSSDPTGCPASLLTV